MPVLFLAAFGFPAGILAGLLISWAPWFLAPAAVVAGLAVGRWRAAAGSPLFIALAAGILWGAAARHVRADDCRLRWHDGQRLSVIAAPSDLSAGPSPSRRYQILEPASCAGPLMVRLQRPDTSNQPLVLAGSWRRDPAFGESRLPRPLEWAGQLVAVRARPVASVPSLRSRMHLAAERRLAVLFGPGRWPLAAAITVSPEAQIPRELRQEFARAGLAHLLAISGLYIGILAGSVTLLLRALRLGPGAARTAATMVAAGYIWLLGFPAPALRAGAMLGFWAWSRGRQRPPAPGTILAASALVIAAAEPWALLQPGPWLSFAGVYGCGSAASWWRRLVDEPKGRGRRRVLRWLTPVALSLGAVLATAPVQALGFGSLTPIGVASNVLAVPVATVTIPALSLSLALISLGASSAARLAASAAGMGLDLLEVIASRASQVAWSSLPVSRPLLVAFVLSLLALWLLRGAPRRAVASRVLSWRVASAVLAILIIAPWAPGALGAAVADGEGRLTLHFLDVGQGDAAAIRTPHGRWIVIDGGPREPGVDEGARKVVPMLRRHGAQAVDVVVASHGDADHLGGLPAVLTSLNAGLVLEPGTPLGRPLYVEWLADVARDGARWHPARAGDSLLLDGVLLRVWHPDSATIAGHWEPNENSVVLTIEYGGFRALFGGDAGLPMEALRARAIGRVTLLKVGHHGSRSATGDPWLAALQPRLCVIEVGARNRYGHPDPGTLARLGEAGCGVWRTDRDGDVDVSTDGRQVTVRAAARDTTLVLCEEQPCGHR